MDFSIVHFYSIVEMEEPMLSVSIKHRPSPLRGEGRLTGRPTGVIRADERLSVGWG